MGTQKNRLDEHTKHMFKLMDKEKITIICDFLRGLNWTYNIALVLQVNAKRILCKPPDKMECN